MSAMSVTSSCTGIFAVFTATNIHYYKLMALQHLLCDVSDGHDYRPLFVWSAVLVGLIVVAYVAYSYLTRWMKSSDESSAPGFTLSDLRQMVKSGQMTEVEFEQARAKMVAAAKKMTEDVKIIRGKRSGSFEASSSDTPAED